MTRDPWVVFVGGQYDGAYDSVRCIAKCQIEMLEALPGFEGLEPDDPAVVIVHHLRVVVGLSSPATGPTNKALNRLVHGV